MAGDWIPMRIGIETDPAVLMISSATNLDHFGVVGRLQKIWGWANENLTDGYARGATGVALAASLDLLVGVTGFCSAMAAAGWLEIEPTGIRFPKFGTWNSQTAKQRALARKRMEKCRNKCDAPSATDVAPPVTVGASPREEKRRRKTIVPTGLPDATHPDAKPATVDPPASLEPGTDPPTVATGNHKLAIEAFCTAWNRKYKEKYPFNGGKDGKAVQWMLAQVGQDLTKFTTIVGRFMSDDDPFFAAADRHSLGKLRQHFARWLVDQPQPQPQTGGTNGFKTKTQQDEDYIMSQIESLTE